MNDYELVIKRSKRLEQLLSQAFGAEGRGLHEKITSAETKLPEQLKKKLRFIASLRNKLVHDETVDNLTSNDRRAFEKACDEAESQLTAMLPTPSRRTGCLVVLATLSGLGALVAAGLVLVTF